MVIILFKVGFNGGVFNIFLLKLDINIFFFLGLVFIIVFFIKVGILVKIG